MSSYAQKPKPWNVEPWFYHPRKEIINISPNLIEILVPYRFPMGLIGNRWFDSN